MENILLTVPDSTAKKWHQASESLKKQATEAVKQMLDTAPVTELTDEEREIRVEEAVTFFSNLSADFTNYKFDRGEANER